MPYIHVTLAAGRSQEEKHALIRALADAAHSTLGAAPPTIRVWVTEVPVTDMSIAGVPLDQVRARRAAGDNSL